MRWNVLLWIVQALLALIFGFAGAMKLILPIEALAGPVALPESFMRFLGVAEVFGAIGLILPALFKIRPVLTALAAVGLVIIMIGATAIMSVAADIWQAIVPMIVGLLSASVAYGRWRVAPIVQSPANETIFGVSSIEEV